MIIFLFFFLSSSDRKTLQIIQVQLQLNGKTLRYCILLPRVKAEGLDLVSPSDTCRSHERKNEILGLGLQELPVVQDGHIPTHGLQNAEPLLQIKTYELYTDYIYISYLQTKLERVILDGNMEIDTTSNGPPLSFLSPHGSHGVQT